ncbi:Protein translocase subunit SecF [hydrothermal vent metagenome]|uniref:Protein translocase subunit SecF n=1 Tax=hydrothermal vent metagenome TaxID=652676 RepID=A0A3B0ZVR4_9ZZZZ
MQIFKTVPTFDFMGKRKLALVFSMSLIIFSLYSLFDKGLNFGLDFTGGVLIEVNYPESVNLENVRATLSKTGYPEASVLHYGTSRDVQIRIAAPKETATDDGKESKSDIVSDIILKALKTADSGVEMRRQEFVGPQVGDELRDDGGLAMIYALAAILIYVMLRFQWRFAFGSIFALIHDVVITLGVFSVFQFNFDLTVLAAVLAIIGYSLNDTIVVFDRIRENFRKLRKNSPTEVINISLNQTLSRTMMTSITTLFVVAAMFALGGEMIHAFSIALLIGIVVGTYSSIYVASSAILSLKVSHADLIQVEKEGADQENFE